MRRNEGCRGNTDYGFIILVAHLIIDLGDAVGVTRQTIAAIEQGKYSPSLEVASKIARHFGKRLEEVFFWREATD